MLINVHNPYAITLQGIEGHELGKKHKEAVQIRLKTVRPTKYSLKVFVVDGCCDGSLRASQPAGCAAHASTIGRTRALLC